jgi:hypothetical protein
VTFSKATLPSARQPDGGPGGRINVDIERGKQRGSGGCKPSLLQVQTGLRCEFNFDPPPGSGSFAFRFRAREGFHASLIYLELKAHFLKL